MTTHTSFSSLLEALAIFPSSAETMLLKFSFATALLGLLSPALAAIIKTRDIDSLFLSLLSPGAEIYFPSQANFTTEVTQRWTIFEAPTYYAAIKPAIPSDVQAIVSLIHVLWACWLTRGSP
jgi:hypothetical protein